MPRLTHVVTVALGVTLVPGWLSPLQAEENVPGEESEHGFVFIDLQPHANVAIDEDFGSYEGNNLGSLPRGRQTLGGVEFRIGEKFIILAGRRGSDWPESVTDIRLDEKVSNLHFLHAAAWGLARGVRVGAEIGSLTVHYQDGTAEQIPIQYGLDVRDWWAFGEDRQPASRALTVWTGVNDASANFRGRRVEIRLFKMTWTNPHPEKTVTRLDYESRNETGCSPFLVAISGSRPELDLAERLRALKRQTFSAVLHPSNSGLPRGASYGDFAVDGPVIESLVPLPRGVGEVARGSSDRDVFGMGGHELYRVDLRRRIARRIVEKDVPEISWAMGITYDVKRDRLLLATLGGEGFLYAYESGNDVWSTVASMNNVDVTAIAYHESLDRVFAIAQEHRTGTILYEFAAGNGALLQSRPIDMPIVGSFIDRALQLVVVNDFLVFIQMPEARNAVRPVISVIDPKSAQTWQVVDGEFVAVTGDDGGKSR